MPSIVYSIHRFTIESITSTKVLFQRHYFQNPDCTTTDLFFDRSISDYVTRLRRATISRTESTVARQTRGKNCTGQLSYPCSGKGD
jgi:hypothetical protein